MAGNELARFIRNDTIQARINSLLDKRASQFTTSLITIANSNAKIASCRPETVLNAALTAASMDLPLNPNLGFAYIIPYGQEAQFQMGWKGFVQLAQRSGKYQTISAAPVYEGQLKSNDPLRGIEFDWAVKPIEGAAPIGYAAFFRLLNGFEKTLYMDMATVTGHGKKYSKSFNSGPWKDNFEAMAQKTVIKLLISKFGPMSTEMESAMVNDQAVITTEGPKYVDGQDLDDVGADDNKKADIIAANTGNPGKTKNAPVIPEAGTISEEELASMGAQEPAKEPKPEEPKESVKEKAMRKYGPKQKTLLETEAKDDKDSHSNPGER